MTIYYQDESVTLHHSHWENVLPSLPPSNLVAACRDCNAGKASSSPDAEHVAQVDDDAARWARARERALAAKNRIAAEERRQPFYEAWLGWDKDGSS